ncbi:MAG: CAP domain-containing protein [bacterium]|nr:CAP domain-containing protein [bacterium]
MMRRKLKNTFIPHRGNHHHPHILRHKSLSAVLTVVVLLEFTMLLSPFVWPRLGIELATVLPSVVTLLTNNARAEGHIANVKVNDILTLAAQAKADDMASKGYFSHIGPDGTKPWYWFKQAGYQYQYAGENLAVNFANSEGVVKAWQNSPMHNLNLLGPRYTETGVGIATGMYKGREAVFVVQFLASSQKTEAGVVNATSTLPKVSGIPSPLNMVNPLVLGVSTEDTGNQSIWLRIISSPRTYGTYALFVLTFLFLLVLLTGWGRHRPRALVYGVMMVGLLAGVIFMNKYLTFPQPELSEDTQNGASFNSR